MHVKKLDSDDDFYFLFPRYAVSRSGSHKLCAVTCKRGSFIPGHVTYKNGYFILTGSHPEE